jgi:DNA mismatch repair protein MutH
MKRPQAVEQLRALIGQDVHMLARNYGISVVGASGKVNKGWAGHVFERHLGLPLNSAQAPNFGSWELKVVPLKRTGQGILQVKETMAVTMIDEWQVGRTPFEESHLLTKLQRAVIVARIVGENVHSPSTVHSVNLLDLKGSMYEQIKDDYELVRTCINDPKRGFGALTGKMGVYIQPRTKGAGHGSTSRAFYARTSFLEKLFGFDSRKAR